MAAGFLDVLSVGRGHLRVTFDKDSPEEVENARRIIEDMLARGASIFVESASGSVSRVKKFNPKRMTYLIDDVPEGQAPVGKRTPKKEVPVASSRATAVGRTAGG